MDSGKVTEECETHSRHAICSPDTAFLFLLVLTDLFKMEWQISSPWKYSCVGDAGNDTLLQHSERGCRFCAEAGCRVWTFISTQCMHVLKQSLSHGIFAFFSCSSGAVQPARQVQKTKNCVHKSAAAGARASVQTE